MLFLHMCFFLILALLSLPVLLFFVQIIFAMPQYRAQEMPNVRRPTLAMLIPAHNESSGVIATLQCLKSQLQAGDRILLVADNCSDDTASIAGAEGVEVIERTNLDQRGKGYALDFGWRAPAWLATDLCRRCT